jgi:uncharacterized membrane protein
MVVYAVIMLLAIANSIDTVTFVLLFAVAPAAIYFFVKKIFPKN